MWHSGTSTACYMQEPRYIVISTTPVKGQAVEDRGVDRTFGCLGELLAAVGFLNW